MALVIVISCVIYTSWHWPLVLSTLSLQQIPLSLIWYDLIIQEPITTYKVDICDADWMWFECTTIRFLGNSPSHITSENTVRDETESGLQCWSYANANRWVFQLRPLKATSPLRYFSFSANRPLTSKKMFTFIFTFPVVCKVPITPSGNFLLIHSSLLMQTFLQWLK